MACCTGPWQWEADVLRHEQETSEMFEQAGEKLRALEELHHSLTERDQVSEIKIQNSKVYLTSTHSDELVSLLGSHSRSHSTLTLTTQLG